jgi:KaiC/GvpD/RAD55 family RecA-like ATPase
MTKKDEIYAFLGSFENETITMQEAWDKFSEINSEIDKPTFSSYRSTAIRDGVFVPLKNSKSKVINLRDIPEEEKMKLEVKTIDLNNIDKSKFTSVATGTTVDRIASKRGGWMPGTVYILTGESGAGKTTIATNIADYLKENNPGFTAGFVSCEMDEFDWTEECLDNPRLATLESVFMLEYLEAPNYDELLMEALKKWQYVILDSFEVVIDQLKEIKGWTAKKAEAELINMLRKAASESGAIIIAIQQYTKGGTFVGSNKIKHMLTGIAFVRFDSNGDRYIEFEKNRRGGHMINQAVYFTKCKETGRLIFDENRFENDRAINKFSSDEKERLQEESSIFDTEIMELARQQEARRLEIIANS